MCLKFIKKDYDNGLGFRCKDCVHYGTPSGYGNDGGCEHEILYDDNGDLMDETEDLILDAMANPRRCVLAVHKDK